MRGGTAAIAAVLACVRIAAGGDAWERTRAWTTDPLNTALHRELPRLVRGSTLYRNDGDGRFTDVTDASGLRDAQWAWAAQFVDYDDDGRQDLYVVNGFITGPLLDDV